MTCITYLCVCNHNESSNVIHQQSQQQSAVYPANHHNYQNWVGLQNYHLLQQAQLPEPPIAIPITAATADFGPYVGGPQPASAVYCQPSTSTAVTTSINDVFQLQVQQLTPSHPQETIVSASTYLKSSSTTVFDLGSGAIHKNPVQYNGNNSSDASWHHYQPATDDYNHQHYQQNCNSSDNDGGIDIACGSDVEVADGIGISDGFQHYVAVDCKTESDCNNEQGGGSLSLAYPISQDVDYYAQFSSIAVDYKDSCNDNTNAINNSMDFVGDSASASLPSGSSSSSVAEFMDPSNNNYYMDTYSESENNATVFNEYNMNNWTSTIDQYSTYDK